MPENRVASRGREPSSEIRRAGKKRKGAKFAETGGAPAIAVCAARQDGHERDASVAGRQGVVNVVAQIERAGGGAPPQNFEQALRMGLNVLHIVHGYHSAKVRGVRPGIEGEGKLPASAAGEEVQLKAAGPTLHLPRRDEEFFVANVAGLPVCSPVEFLESHAR